MLDGQATVISNRAPLTPPPTSEPPAAADPASTAELPSPVRLGHFQLTGFIGGGGMGRVFRAHDTELHRTVAVKVLPRDQVGDAGLVARFRNEAQSAARLNHENIIQVFHVGEEDGLPYIVFEFVEGLNIRALVAQKGTLPLAEALSYTYQVARALAHVAASGVVHRDVKPSNVLVTKDGRVKLIDMGLARVQRTADGVGELTASGVTLGTFDYISPEQARDPRTADVRSDIYSLGCTLYYMLTGRPPFPEGTVLQKLLQHQGEKPPEVRDFRPELPEAVSHLLMRMMAKEPRRRFQTPAELIAAGGPGRRSRLAPASLGPPGWVVPRRPKLRFLQRHIPWLAPLALLLVAVLAMQFARGPSSESADGEKLLVGMTEEPASHDPGDPAAPDPANADPGEPVVPPVAADPPLPKPAVADASAPKPASDGTSPMEKAPAPGKVKPPAGPASGGAGLRPAASEGGLSLAEPAVVGLSAGRTSGRPDRVDRGVRRSGVSRCGAGVRPRRRPRDRPPACWWSMGRAASRADMPRSKPRAVRWPIAA